MLRDVEPFDQIWRLLKKGSPSTEAVISFVHFIEKKLGARLFYDSTDLPSRATELLDLFELAERLRENGILLSLSKASSFPDEPPISLWHVRYREGEEGIAAGVAVNDDRHALITALAETTERYLWFEASDYLSSLTPATVRTIAKKGRHIDPLSFAGYSPEQRRANARLALSDQSVFLWIPAASLTHKDSVYLPAQTACPRPEAMRLIHQKLEPYIRRLNTTGLATHPTREEALLSGALEIIERDAYMIAWLNQLTLPRIDLAELAKRRASLATLLEHCVRYRLRAHVVRLITDAPAYAFCAIVEDESGLAPRLMLGLKAHRDPAYCAERAILEALRARRGTRTRLASDEFSKPSKAEEVGHFERLTYWASGERDRKLDFLYAGPVKPLRAEVWENDTPAAHLERIAAWCRTRGYEFASVPLTHSKKNLTGWHVEMVIIPHMQPMYYSERLPHVGGERLHEIPAKFGYKPRGSFYTDEPHPFA